jgi:hypothetical protein
MVGYLSTNAFDFLIPPAGSMVTDFRGRRATRPETGWKPRLEAYAEAPAQAELRPTRAGVNTLRILQLNS